MISLVLRLFCIPVVVGAACFLFSTALQFTGPLALQMPWLIFLAPAVGALTCYYNATMGHNIPKLHELHKYFSSHKKIWRGATPFIFFWTQASHLVGASVGRESPATIMGLSLAELCKGKKLKGDHSWEGLFWNELFLRAGIAAGFGAVFGVPVAGAIFAISLAPLWRWPLLVIVVCGFSSAAANWIALTLGLRHTFYPPLKSMPTLNLEILFFLLAILTIAVFYLAIRHYFLFLLEKIKKPMVRGFTVGVLLIAILQLAGLQYASMSLATLSQAFSGIDNSQFFIVKGWLTLLSNAGVYVGGEVTPLMTVAATAANSIGHLLSLSEPIALLASLSVVAFLALIFDAPLAMAILGCELFGWNGFTLFILSSYFTHRTGQWLWKKILVKA